MRTVGHHALTRPVNVPPDSVSSLQNNQLIRVPPITTIAHIGVAIPSSSSSSSASNNPSGSVFDGQQRPQQHVGISTGVSPPFPHNSTGMPPPSSRHHGSGGGGGGESIIDSAQAFNLLDDEDDDDVHLGSGGGGHSNLAGNMVELENVNMILSVSISQRHLQEQLAIKLERIKEEQRLEKLEKIESTKMQSAGSGANVVTAAGGAGVSGAKNEPITDESLAATGGGGSTVKQEGGTTSSGTTMGGRKGSKKKALQQPTTLPPDTPLDVRLIDVHRKRVWRASTTIRDCKPFGIADDSVYYQVFGDVFGHNAHSNSTAGGGGGGGGGVESISELPVDVEAFLLNHNVTNVACLAGGHNSNPKSMLDTVTFKVNGGGVVPTAAAGGNTTSSARNTAIGPDGASILFLGENDRTARIEAHCPLRGGVHGSLIVATFHCELVTHPIGPLFSNRDDRTTNTFQQSSSSAAPAAGGGVVGGASSSSSGGTIPTSGAAAMNSGGGAVVTPQSMMSGANTTTGQDPTAKPTGGVLSYDDFLLGANFLAAQRAQLQRTLEVRNMMSSSSSTTTTTRTATNNNAFAALAASNRPGLDKELFLALQHDQLCGAIVQSALTEIGTAFNTICKVNQRLRQEVRSASTAHDLYLKAVEDKVLAEKEILNAVVGIVNSKKAKIREIAGMLDACRDRLHQQATLAEDQAEEIVALKEEVRRLRAGAGGGGSGATVSATAGSNVTAASRSQPSAGLVTVKLEQPNDVAPQPLRTTAGSARSKSQQSGSASNNNKRSRTQQPAIVVDLDGDDDNGFETDDEEGYLNQPQHDHQQQLPEKRKRMEHHHNQQQYIGTTVKREPTDDFVPGQGNPRQHQQQHQQEPAGWFGAAPAPGMVNVVSQSPARPTPGQPAPWQQLGGGGNNVNQLLGGPGLVTDALLGGCDTHYQLGGGGGGGFANATATTGASPSVTPGGQPSNNQQQQEDLLGQEDSTDDFLRM